MTTSTGRDCDESTPRQNDSYQNPNSAMSSSQQPPPSGPILPGGPNGPDGTIIEEVMTPIVGRKQPVRGQAYRAQNGEYVSYFCTDEEVLYRPGDSVYIESQKADQPFFICTILEFRRSKRDNLMVNIKWFYRPSEVPETVYQLLIQDRSSENNNKTSTIDVPSVKSRELFISDATDTYPVSVLRGICKVEHYADIHAVREFQTEPNSFFYILGYNPETRRLASTQGEIRIGPSHQAKLPEYRGQLDVDDQPEQCEDWEEICWQPAMIDDETLLMYLRAARSMAAFASMCDNGSLTDGNNAASKDSTTIGALNVLHETNYNHDKALQTLTKCPIPEDISKKWSEEDIKRFVKGLRLYGKNFFRIRKEFISHKETKNLVSFYYLWKKTPAATGHRPHRRHRRQNILRRIRTPRGAASKSAPSDPLDPSSTSEKEDDSDDSDSKDRQGYHCRHCYTTASRDWHHAGKCKLLFCYDCRMHFKHYGDLPVITNPRDPPPPSTSTRQPQQPVISEEVGMRTRTRAKEISTRQRVSLRSGGNTPDIVDDSDSQTIDRRTPDPRPSRRSVSPTSKKMEEKVEKVKRAQIPEETFVAFSGNNRKEDQQQLDAISDESMDSVSDETSSKSAGDNKSAVPPTTTPNKETELNMASIQDCSVILETPPVSSENQLAAMYRAADTATSFGRSSSPVAGSNSGSSGEELLSLKRPHSTDENDSHSKYAHFSATSTTPNYPSTSATPNYSAMSLASSEQATAASSKPLAICPPYSPHTSSGALPEVAKGNVDIDTLPSRVTSATTGEVSPFTPIHLDVGTVVNSPSRPTSEALPASPLPKDATLISHDVASPHVSKVFEAPLMMPVAQNPHAAQSFAATGTAPPSVIHTCHGTGVASGSRTPLPSRPVMGGSSGGVGGALSVASMLAQPSRISLVPASQLRMAGAHSPAGSPPPAHSIAPPMGHSSASAAYSAAPAAHSSATMSLPRHFISSASPPAAHPGGSPQLYRPHPLPHSAIALAHSALNISSMIAVHDKATKSSSSGQLPKDPLSLISGPCNVPGVESSLSGALKMAMRGQEGGAIYMGDHALTAQHAHNILPMSSNYGALPSRADKPNPSAPPMLGHDFSVKLEHENLAYPALGINFPYGKPPYHDSPLSLSSAVAEPIKSQKIPSPVHPSLGSRIICGSNSGPSYVKKELDFGKERIKQEVSSEYYRPEYKPDIGKLDRMDLKQERCDVKPDRHDRPEIIAEIKSAMPTNLSVAGLIAPTMPPMPTNPYPFPYMSQHQSALMAAKFQRPSSPPNLSIFPKNPVSPPILMRGPAPPAHLGMPMFSGRPGISSASKPPPIQHSPGVPVKSPISAGRLGLPTPPAAHTGPVRPPIASHPMHSPLSCIAQGPQIGGHSLLQHALPHPPSPTCPSDQPPTTQALPPTVPPHSTFNNGSGIIMHDGDDNEDDDDVPSQREPSPAPKIEDSVFHRSHCAIFVRHWYRGENSSCARTDITFKPVPDSTLCRKREERARRQAEREEKERYQKKAATPEKRETPKSVAVSISEAHVPSYPSCSSMYERLMPRTSDIPISTMPRLGSMPTYTSALRPQALGLPPTFPGGLSGSHMDPLLQHYNATSLYPLGSRERLELERERDLDRLKDEMLKQRSHLEGLASPYGVGLPPHLLAGPRFASQLQSAGHGQAFAHPGLYAHPPATLFAAERERYERMALANYHAASRPPLMRQQSETHQRLTHGYPPAAHAALLGRPFEEQLAHQRAAQEQLQRQMLMERDRLTQQYNPPGHFRP